MTGHLRVRVGTTYYGLGVEQLIEVIDEYVVFPAPGLHESVVGVTPVRRRMVPVVRLAALIAGGGLTDQQDHVVVLAQCRGATIAVEVDDAEELVLDEPLPVPDSWHLPWASGVVNHGSELIPVIDLEVLAERLLPAELELESASD